MTSETRRFSLSRFGGAVGGSGADDGYKFSNIDRDVIDALLAYLETHTHEHHAALADPSGPPTGTVSNSGGTFQPGLALHYVITYFDTNGMETAASDVLIVNTPDVASAPGLPALVGGTGGQLVVGNYTYWLTAVTDGVESAPSVSSSITLQTGQSAVTVTIVDPPETPFNVYRQGPADIAGYKIAQIAEGSTSYTDTGVVAPSDINYDPTQTLPVGGATVAGAYSVTINVPAADVSTVSALPGWRVYRSNDGSFTNPCLVQTVTETVNPDGGGLVTTFIDTGASMLMAGEPPPASRTLASYPVAGGGSGGGGGYVQAPVLTDSAGRQWLVSCQVDGGLDTVRDALVGTLYNPGYGPCIADSSGQYWQMDVDTDGVLSTTAVSPAANDPIFDADAGPVYYFARDVGFRLSVGTDGALTTTAL